MSRYPLPVVLLLITACTDKGPADDVADVRSTYTLYMEALRSGNGELAATLADHNTVAYYEEMLQLARVADSVEVSSLDIMDRITVLGLRAQAGSNELAGMDARGAIAAGASTGMMGGEELGAMELGKITVDGDHAWAPMRMGGFPIPAEFHFSREEDGWKVDITKLFPITRMVFEQMARGSSLPTNEWLMRMLTGASGDSVDNSIWHAPAKP